MELHIQELVYEKNFCDQFQVDRVNVTQFSNNTSISKNTNIPTPIFPTS